MSLKRGPKFREIGTEMAADGSTGSNYRVFLTQEAGFASPRGEPSFQGAMTRVINNASAHRFAPCHSKGPWTKDSAQWSEKMRQNICGAQPADRSTSQWRRRWRAPGSLPIALYYHQSSNDTHANIQPQ